MMASMLKSLLSRRPDSTGEEGQERPYAGPGMTIETRRQLLVKLCWMFIWMVYLFYPVGDLVQGHHTLAATVVGWVALTLFVTGYVSLIVSRSILQRWELGCRLIAAGMVITSVATTIGLGANFTALFTYTSVAVGVVLPLRFAAYGVAGTTLLCGATGFVFLGPDDQGGLIIVMLTTFLSGMAMTGMQRLVTAMRELRAARETVAHLAAAEERLRLARDLHDLLGHSLSLITLKSELAGRFMDQDKDAEARAQVADIEKVARQSLIDVREAVGGYRRASLPVELAAARTALSAAQIELDAHPSLLDERPGLRPEEAGALAWALRESVTNIIRHAEGATGVTVTLDETWEGEGDRYAALEITDNGRGAGKSGPGNGLSGLEERLALVDGRLETSPGPRGKGFRLRALVPLRPAAVPATSEQS